MGSSPLTATIPLPPTIAEVLDGCLAHLVRPGDGVLVAFSGGPDSTALLAALTLWAPARRLRLEAAHLDHRLDPDSGRRAAAARAIALRLGVTFWGEALHTSPDAGSSLEAWAREQRYAFLHRLADERNLCYIVTAHHADDQAETLVLRLVFGSGLAGLAGIRRCHGRVLRPLLEVPRCELASFVADLATHLGIAVVEDPTNCDLARPRNFVRHQLIPRLARDEPWLDVAALSRQLAAVARRAAEVLPRIERRLAEELGVAEIQQGGKQGARLDRRAFESLPDDLVPLALGLLARRAGAPYPAAASVRQELLRQLAAGGRVGCAAGGRQLIEADSRELRWLRAEPPMGGFAYTGSLPGVVEIPELGLRIRLERSVIAPWMFCGRPDRAALTGMLADDSRITIRSRLPGDRIRPLGSRRRRRLKELLIDHRVPRRQRDRLPLLVVGDEIAWVPGITIGDDFRLTDDTSVWLVVIEKAG